MPDLIGGAIMLLVGAVALVLEFMAITGWMVSLGVDPTVASLIGAAAIFGEIGVAVKVLI